MDRTTVAANIKWGRTISWLNRHLLTILSVLVILFAGLQYVEEGLVWYRWDFMLMSGLVTYIIALYFARLIPQRMRGTLDRLLSRGALESSSAGLDEFNTTLEKRAGNWGMVGGLVVSGALMAAFFFAYQGALARVLVLLILELLLGYVAGYYLGQMVAFGTMGQLLRREGVQIVTQPGHVDKAAGLKPVGDLYFFQAMLVAIPCVFLAVWWFIIPIWPVPWYSHWRDPYLALLVVALVFEILAFILPMWAFHRDMQEQKKTKWLKKADELSKKIATLQADIIAATDTSQIRDLQKQLDLMIQHYWDYEGMPTWPVDYSTRRRFTINNLVLFFPVVIDVVGATNTWKDLAEILIEILGGNR